MPRVSEDKAKYIISMLRYRHWVDAENDVDAITRAVAKILGVPENAATALIVVHGHGPRYRVCVRGHENKYCVHATVYRQGLQPPLPGTPIDPRRRRYVVTFH